jgi:hypothetical protein
MSNRQVCCADSAHCYQGAGGRYPLRLTNSHVERGELQLRGQLASTHDREVGGITIRACSRLRSGAGTSVGLVPLLFFDGNKRERLNAGDRPKVPAFRAPDFIPELSITVDVHEHRLATTRTLDHCSLLWARLAAPTALLSKAGAASAVGLWRSVASGRLP